MVTEKIKMNGKSKGKGMNERWVRRGKRCDIQREVKETREKIRWRVRKQAEETTRHWEKRHEREDEEYEGKVMRLRRNVGC